MNPLRPRRNPDEPQFMTLLPIGYVFDTIFGLLFSLLLYCGLPFIVTSTVTVIIIAVIVSTHWRKWLALPNITDGRAEGASTSDIGSASWVRVEDAQRPPNLIDSQDDRENAVTEENSWVLRESENTPRRQVSRLVRALLLIPNTPLSSNGTHNEGGELRMVGFKVRQQEFIQRWFISPDEKLAGPPRELPANQTKTFRRGDLYSIGSDMWIFSEHMEWERISEGDEHPTLVHHRLHLRVNGMPSWVLRKTFNAYENKKRRGLLASP